MTCRDTLPDGNPCDAEDRHTDPEMGLCGSCGAAPKSMALVPVARAEVEFDEDLPLKCRLFLETYVKTRRLGLSATRTHRG